MSHKGYTGIQARIAHSKKLNETVPGGRIEESDRQSDTLPTTMPKKKFKTKQTYLEACLPDETYYRSGVDVFDPLTLRAALSAGELARAGNAGYHLCVPLLSVSANPSASALLPTPFCGAGRQAFEAISNLGQQVQAPVCHPQQWPENDAGRARDIEGGKR